MGLGAGQVATEADFVGIDPPLVKLVSQAVQVFNDATNTACVFGVGSEEIDTDDFHDEATNNTRITPNVEGYYKFTGTTFWPAATTYATIATWIRKNGSATTPCPGSRMDNRVNATVTSQEVTVITYMNGTTDYVELLGVQDNTASANLNSVNTDVAGTPGAKNTFTCEFLRRV